jgi:alpha-galactosidase
MAEITYDETSQTWLLRMQSSSYGLVLAGPNRLPRSVHWGPLIDHASLASMVDGGAVDRFIVDLTGGEEDPLEYVGWGGKRFDEPSFKVDFSDGTRGVAWRLVDNVVTRADNRTTLTLSLADLVYPLQVDLCYRIYDDSDVIERWVRVVNGSEHGTMVVRQALSANWWMPWRSSWRLTYLHGGWASETQVAETRLTPGKIVLESRRGSTSRELQPWFALDSDGAALEESGEVWSGALAWSGSWKIVAESTPGGRVHVGAGRNDFDAPLHLAPGSEMNLPVCAGLYSSAGFGTMSRSWHDYELRHVMRGARFQAGGAEDRRRALSTSSPSRPLDKSSFPPLRPVLYNSWEATSFAVNADGQIHLAQLAAEMGAELFVMDDGWFVGRQNDHAGLGDWTPDRDKFPDGLDPLIGRVHALGMGFGLWIEPEMVNPESALYRAHPDWVVHFENRPRTEQRNQLVLNLARNDVAEWVFSTLDRLLSAHAINFLKWDLNRYVSEPGWPAEVGNNPERFWIDYVLHLYEILDRVRAAHPEVDIESCAGGGGRVDLGILSRSEQVWTSDNTDAWDRISIQEGFSYVYPSLGMGAWVTDSPNPYSHRSVPLRYRFHVAMAGALGIGGDLTRWSTEDLAEARELVATYKAIRPIVQHGQLYRLASARRGDLAAVEYLARHGSEAVVIAWRGVCRLGPGPSHLRLAGLEPTARYQVAGTGEVHTGAALLHLGLRVPDRLDYASRLVHLIRLPADAGK